MSGMTPPIRMVSVPETDGPDVIWLEPSCCADPINGRMWCEDAAFEECDGHPAIKPTKYIRADLTAAPVREEGGVVDRVMAVLNYWFNGSCRIDRNSEMVRQLAALATREEAPAEAGEDVNWKAEYEAVCEARVSDRQKSQEIINERDKWIVELIRERDALRAQPQAHEGGPSTLAELHAAERLIDQQAAEIRRLKAREEAQPEFWMTKAGLRNFHKGTDPEAHVLLRQGGNLRVALYTTPPAPEAEKLRVAMPDLSSVIAWLDNGCDPKHAVIELTIYKARIDQALAAPQQEGR